MSASISLSVGFRKAQSFCSSTKQDSQPEDVLSKCGCSVFSNPTNLKKNRNVCVNLVAMSYGHIFLYYITDKRPSFEMCSKFILCLLKRCLLCVYSFTLIHLTNSNYLLCRWVLYVNGKEKITDCPSVNDGRWHHITVTWTNSDGSWKVYIDGRLSDGGKGLSVGMHIPGGQKQQINITHLLKCGVLKYCLPLQ